MTDLRICLSFVRISPPRLDALQFMSRYRQSGSTWFGINAYIGNMDGCFKLMRNSTLYFLLHLKSADNLTVILCKDLNRLGSQ